MPCFDNIAYLGRCMYVLKIENLYNVQNTMYFKLELSNLGFKMLSMKINYSTSWYLLLLP